MPGGGGGGSIVGENSYQKKCNCIRPNTAFQITRFKIRNYIKGIVSRYYYLFLHTCRDSRIQFAKIYLLCHLWKNFEI
jgi:hypothetical protein